MPLIRRLIAVAAIATASAMSAAQATPCSASAADAAWQAPRVGGDTVTFEEVLSDLTAHRVVMVGENHERYDHHLTQLEIICRLARDRRPIAIAMEAFQAPFQDALDRFVRSHRDLDRMLLETEYFMRWGFDARLVAPILEFAAERRIPIIALNASSEMVAKVSRDGPEGLKGKAGRDLARAVASAPEGYVRRLKAVFEQHPGHEKRDFDHFLAVQLLWDEHMAARASEWLRERPDHRLVVLGGAGHIEHADAIPARLTGVADAQIAVVAQTLPPDAAVPVGGHGLVNAVMELPEPGRIGVILDRRSQRVLVGGFVEISAGRDAGMLVGDEFTRIDGRTIDSVAALRVALWRKRPGDPIDLVLRRDDSPLSMRFALR